MWPFTDPQKKEQEKLDEEHRQAILRQENAALFSQLTNKNDAFFRQFHKLMKDHQYHEGRDPLEVDHAILTRLVEGQKRSETAQKIYGTPTALVDYVENAPTPEETAPPTFGENLIDNGFFITGLLTALAGIILLFNQQRVMMAQPGGAMFGPFALVINFLGGGAAMAILMRYQPNLDAPKGQRGIGRYLLAALLSILVWLFALTVAVAIIPPQINPLLPPFAYILIAVGAFVARHFYRQWRNFPQRVQQ